MYVVDVGIPSGADTVGPAATAAPAGTAVQPSDLPKHPS